MVVPVSWWFQCLAATFLDILYNFTCTCKGIEIERTKRLSFGQIKMRLLVKNQQNVIIVVKTDSCKNQLSMFTRFLDGG